MTQNNFVLFFFFWKKYLDRLINLFGVINLKLALLVLLVIFIIFIIVPIYIRVELNRKKNDDTITLRVALLKGLINFRYEISYLDLFDNLSKDEKENNNDKNIDEELQREEGLLRLKKIFYNYHNVKKYKETIKAIFKYIFCKIDFNSLRWSSRIGLGDAALTAIVYGAISTIAGTLLNVILNYKDIKKMSVNIYPEFNENILEIDFFCIIKIKIAHIIIAGYKGIIVFIKGGVINA